MMRSGTNFSRMPTLADRETIKNFTVETLSVHMAVVLSVVLASYGVSALLAKVPAIGSLLKQLPVWSIAMVLMLLVNKL